MNEERQGRERLLLIYEKGWLSLAVCARRLWRSRQKVKFTETERRREEEKKEREIKKREKERGSEKERKVSPARYSPSIGLSSVPVH